MKSKEKIQEYIKTHKKKFIVSGIILIVLVTAALLWYRWPYNEYEGLGMRPELDVADNIAVAPAHQIFASALYDFEYNTFLHGNGPFTVFVPTDAGYNDLSPEMKFFLNDNNNQGYIRQILLYHVVKGRYLAEDLKDGMMLETVQGEKIIVTRVGEQWIINGAALIQTRDAISSNGVIHVISNYLLPPSVAVLE